MSDSYSTPLARAIKLRGIRQADLAKLAGTTKQQIGKLVRRRVLSQEWARRLAPHLGLTWVDLLEGHLPEQTPTDIERRVAIGQRDPFPGEPLNDLDELALIGAWRKLSRTKKAALFGYLDMDDMPSLSKVV